MNKNNTDTNHNGDSPNGNENRNDYDDEPLTDYEAESEFLEALAANLRRPFLYRISKEEKAELRRIVLLDLEFLLDDLVGEYVPRPKTYRTKGDYYVVEGLLTVGLRTGCLFYPGIKAHQEGEGDVYEIWSLFKQCNFYGAVSGLTLWAINLRNKREWQRQRVNSLPGNAVRQLVWQAFEDLGLISGGKVLFPKANGKKHVSWTTARAIWKLLEQAYGELCRYSRDTDAFSSPHKVRELLDEYAESRDDRRFKVLRRWRPKEVPLEKALIIEYAFVPTDVPLDF